MLTAVELDRAPEQSDQPSHARPVLVSEHLQLVRRIAQKLVVNMPCSVEIEDLVQSGMVGLLEAAQRYRGREGASFATFAYHRIRGAMIDTIRGSRWMSRGTMRRIGRFEKVKRQLSNSAPDGILPSATQIAAAAGVSIDEYFRTLRDARQSEAVSLEECGSPGSGRAFLTPIDSAQGPEAQVESDEARSLLQEAIARLEDSDRDLLSLYYGEERLLREIGDMRNISESRVCQIRKRIVGRLRVLLEDRWAGVTNIT
jgi:RNA polymerase sigma factor for flagellar operon FliA